jgi:hypothetical protein
VLLSMARNSSGSIVLALSLTGWEERLVPHAQIRTLRIPGPALDGFAALSS